MVGIKAAVGHRVAWGKIAAAEFTVNTSGPCTSDIARLPYTKLRRPVFPLDPLELPASFALLDPLSLLEHAAAKRPLAAKRDTHEAKRSWRMLRACLSTGGSASIERSSRRTTARHSKNRQARCSIGSVMSSWRIASAFFCSTTPDASAPDAAASAIPVADA